MTGDSPRDALYSALLNLVAKALIEHKPFSFKDLKIRERQGEFLIRSGAPNNILLRSLSSSFIRAGACMELRRSNGRAENQEALRNIETCSPDDIVAFIQKHCTKLRLISEVADIKTIMSINARNDRREVEIHTRVRQLPDIVSASAVPDAEAAAPLGN